MALSSNGRMENKLAKVGQKSTFVEHYRRFLEYSENILAVLDYSKPLIGFCRRFELDRSNKNNQMSSCNTTTNMGTLLLPMDINENESISSMFCLKFEEKYVQANFVDVPTVPPRRKLSTPTSNFPQLLTLKGDEDNNVGLLISLRDNTDFGSPGSEAKICLKRLSKYDKKIICSFNKSMLNSQESNKVIFDVYDHTDLNITINGVMITGNVVLKSGDIINIGDFYSFFYKSNSPNSSNLTKVKNYIRPTCVNNADVNDYSKAILPTKLLQKVIAVNSNNSSEINLKKQFPLPIYDPHKRLSIDLNGITLECFDTAFNQIVIHYFNYNMEFIYAVGFILYLIRFCRECARCGFTIDDMHNKITKGFNRILEETDNDIIGHLKLLAIEFEIWMVYYSDNNKEFAEENKQWLNLFESLTIENFDHLSDYICEEIRNMILCFFDKKRLCNIDKFQRDEEENEDEAYTIDDFLKFLDIIYQNVNKIDCVKTVRILKRVLTARIIIFITESIVTIFLSDTDNYNWKIGVNISKLVDRIENWLNDNGLISIYKDDGFLHDFSKLISTRSTVLEKMDWKSLRLTYQRIPTTILRQFLSALMKLNNSSVIIWQPPPHHISESNQDVSDILSEYLQSAVELTLFQSKIVEQTDCIPIDKVISSAEFVSICTVLDTEHIAMASTFRWIILPKPHSLVHFENNKLKKLNKPKTKLEKSFNSQDYLREKNKVPISLSIKPENFIDKQKILEKYRLLKTKMNSNSSSFVSFINSNNSTVKQLKNIDNQRGTNERERSASFAVDAFSRMTTVDIDEINDPSYNATNEEKEQPKQYSISGFADNIYKNNQLHSKMPERLRSQSLYSLKLKKNGNFTKIEVIFFKSPEDTYGITITDGKEMNLNLEGIFIYKISKHSPADKNGSLSPGDKILAINDYSVNTLTFSECLLLMTKSTTELKLQIEKASSETTQWIKSLY